jgi:hypothetical protein
MTIRDYMNYSTTKNKESRTEENGMGQCVKHAVLPSLSFIDELLCGL